MGKFALILTAGVCALALNVPALAQEAKPPAGAAAGKEDKPAKLADSETARAPVQEQAKTSHHSVTINGKAIGYTATAGTLTLRDDDGKPTASMFYVAYVADGGKGQADRPVTFFYNGGPGSSSLWLHMGSFGPVTVKTNAPNPASPAPFVRGNNNDSLLDKSDLVFLDAIGAGYSRPLGDTPGTKFWGVDQDIAAFARGVTRYITINHRWNSPKFLFGESYGTTRTAGLAYELQDEGVALNGVLILSSILNYGTRDAGFDHIYQTYLPSYAATAAYHHKLANPPADLTAFLQEVRDFANGPYVSALAKGDTISPAELDAVASKMSAYTGLSVDFLKRANLRVDLQRFRKELLRDQRRTVGRYDSRFTAIDVDAAGESPEYDASDVQVSGPFTAALHDYLEQDLGYTTDLAYFPSGPGINQAWDWKHKAPGANRASQVADTAQDLSMAMRQNPKLKLYSLNGLYDMATPFFGTEYDINHMQLDPTLKGNVRFAYYPSGHMVYLNPQALTQMKADVAKFYDDAMK
ncbi:S10 family peptidase [Phenylobacterium aquaticum]|uniref:S10 family peptidase n=1 Tax=Phenylobacterium aquaticum TaxID=1763816 RepID=UPI0026E98C31|nr:peptidase S10 [Phenylobacterium aquaticum]